MNEKIKEIIKMMKERSREFNRLAKLDNETSEYWRGKKSETDFVIRLLEELL
jgi:hypothetical protein